MDSLSMLAQLTPRLRAVAAKRAGLALALWGEAGIGKTWTTGELLSGLACRSCRVQVGKPLDHLILALPRPKRLPSWADASLRRLEHGGVLEPAVLVDTLSALLAALVPIVLLLEDLHEGEPVRLELWRQLAARARHTKGLALLATSRPEPPEPFEALRLTGLAEAATQALLEREAGAPLPEAAVRWIYARTEGNPLFTLEYFRYLARLGQLWNDTQRWHWRAPPEGLIPGTVEALIERLLYRSGEGQARDVLEAAALLPAEASTAQVFAVAEVAEGNAEVLRALAQTELFAGGRFIHPLFREVVRRSLPPVRRRDLARRALAVFAGDPQTAAGLVGEAELEPEAALALLERAANEARAAGRLYRAAWFQAQAVPYAAGETRTQLALAAAEVLQRYDLHEASRLCEDALARAAPTLAATELYTRLLAQQGRMLEVEALLTALPPPLRAQLEPAALLLSRYHLAGEHQAALQLWETHPELHRNPTPEGLRAVAGSALASGQIVQAQAFVEAGLRAAGEGELRRDFLSLQSLVLYHQSRYEEAEAVSRDLLALPELSDNPRAKSSALVNRAALLRMLGRYADMGVCLEEALAIRQTSGDAKAYAFAQAALAELSLEQGHFERAEELLGEALETLERYGPSRFLTNTHAMASLLYSAQATPLSRLLALKHGERALRSAHESGNPRVIRESLFEASIANTLAGDIRRGLELAGEADALAEAAGNSPHDACRTAWARALALEAAGEVEEATEHFRRALELAREVGVELDAQKLVLELARLSSDRTGARACLAWFTAHGLGYGVKLVHRYFPELVQPASKAERRVLEVRLEVLGPMRLVKGGAVQPVQGRKRRELLALLLEARLAGHGELGQLDLIDALYPDEAENIALGALKQLVFQTRKSLGDGVIVRTSGGYALGAGTSDAELFLAQRDARLWRGVYLEGLSSEEAVQHVLYEALRQAAERELVTDPQEAARLGKLLLEANPYDFSALRLTLQALAGDSRSLSAVYARSRRLFAEVGELLPETWTAFLAAPGL